MAASITNPFPEGGEGREQTLSGVAWGTALICVVLAFTGAYAASFAWMLPVWLDYRAHYGHGLLVIGLVFYLLWQERARLPGSELRPLTFTLMTLAILIASAAWFASASAGIRVPTVLAGLPVAWFAMSVVLGHGGLRRLAPYFALIVSVIPIWQILSPGLQALATRVVNGVLHTLGLTIFMEGNTIVMPEITFEIVGGCSGLGFLLVAFTLAMYLAVSHRLRFASGCFLVLGFAAMALFANWLRITLIMLAGYYYGAENALVHDHLWFGWAIFATILIVAIFLLLPRLPLPPNDESLEKGSVGRLPFPAFFLLIAAVTGLPMFKLGLDAFGRWNAPAPAWVAPVDSAFGEIPRQTAWRPEYPQAPRTSMNTYQGTSTSGQTPLSLFQAYYPSQTDQAEVIDADNDLVGEGWESLGKRRLQAVLNGETRPVGEMLLTNNAGDRMAVWFWYRIGGAHASTDRRAKIEQVIQKLKLRADAMLIAVAASCSVQSCDIARQELGEFTRVLDTDDSRR